MHLGNSYDIAIFEEASKSFKLLPEGVGLRLLSVSGSWVQIPPPAYFLLNPITKALFVRYQSSNRLDRNGLYTAIAKYGHSLELIVQIPQA